MRKEVVSGHRLLKERVSRSFPFAFPDFQSDAQAQALTLTEVAFVLESRKLGMMDSMGMGEKLHPWVSHCRFFLSRLAPF